MERHIKTRITFRKISPNEEMSYRDLSRRGELFKGFSMISPLLEICFEDDSSWLHCLRKILQTRRCPGTHIRARTTLYKFFDDISSSWNMFPDDSIVNIFETFRRTRRCRKKMYQDEEYSSNNSMIFCRLEICSEDDSSRLFFLWKISQDEKMSWKDVSRREVHFKRNWLTKNRRRMTSQDEGLS